MNAIDHVYYCIPAVVISSLMIVLVSYQEGGCDAGRRRVCRREWGTHPPCGGGHAGILHSKRLIFC